MLNGDAPSLVVNDHQVGTYVSGFTIEREWSLVSYHFIKEGIHEDAPHAVLVNMIEQTGDGGCVNGFAALHS